ncbi:hypothetical protein [Aquimarina sediminis]|uniref:hypothetical protein n=1 Tax=Aquimarina sediminis TaxID=2070536 RepID=UPI000CA00E61|nr:hypothetical protein [Aquimarina sediminis]
MKLFNIRFIIIFLLTTTVFSQKVDLDKERASIYFVQLPEDPILDKSKRTYSVHSSVTSFEEKIKLYGFTKTKEDGVIQIKITVNDVGTTPVKISERIKEEKDRDGNVTGTKTFYQASMQYAITGKCFVTIKGKEEYNFPLGNKGEFKSKETNSLEHTKKYFPTNRSTLVENVKKQFIQDKIGLINDKLNHFYGYPTDLREQAFWVLDSEKNTDYEGYQRQYKRIKEVFLRMKANQPVTSSHTQYLDNFETYFNELVERYPLDSKKHKKMRYASYFNLAQLYYNFDMPDKAILYANKLIENGYDKSNGKKIIKRANTLKELFSKNKVSSTHFMVETIDDLPHSPVDQNTEETVKKEAPAHHKKEVTESKNTIPNTIYQLSGNSEENTPIIKKIIEDIEATTLVFGDFGLMLEGEYTIENDTVSGKKYYSLSNDDKYKKVSLIIKEGKIIGADLNGSTLDIVFEDGIVKRISAKSLSNFDYTFYRNADGRVSKIENPFSNGRVQWIDFTYKNGKVSEVIKYFKKGKLGKIVTTILESTPNTFKASTSEYPHKVKEFSKQRNITVSKLGENKFKTERVFDFGEGRVTKTVTNLQYTDFDKIKRSSKTTNETKKDVEDYEYLDEKLSKTTRIVSKDGKTLSKTVNIFFDLKDQGASLPEYEWREGRYEFDANNELNFVERDGKFKRKENGAWSDWKYMSM